MFSLCREYCARGVVIAVTALVLAGCVGDYKDLAFESRDDVADNSAPGENNITEPVDDGHDDVSQGEQSNSNGGIQNPSEEEPDYTQDGCEIEGGGEECEEQPDIIDSPDNPEICNPIDDSPRVLQITAGADYNCILVEGGEVYCWGDNEHGQLGDGGELESSTLPRRIETLENVEQISAGALHSCARLTGGMLRCWGDNVFGQLGLGEVSDKSFPRNVNNITDAQYLGLGYAHSCSVTTTGSVYCWGFGLYGQLGDEDDQSRTNPIPVEALSHVLEIAGGVGHTCARSSDSSVRCWGANKKAQLAQEDTDIFLSPPRIISQIVGAAEIAVGYYHVCVRHFSGNVKCWGDNEFGQLGGVAEEVSAAPVEISLPAPAIRVDTRKSHGCAIVEGGRVYCWGENTDGQLGDGNVAERSTPVPVSGIDNAVDIAVGLRHTCAVLSGCEVVCWGSNEHSQLGQNSIERSVTPVAVPKTW